MGKARGTPGWRLVALGIVWTVLVGAGGFCYGALAALRTGGACSSRQVREYEAMARSSWLCTVVLVLAPWVVGAIVHSLRSSRSRTSAPAEPLSKSSDEGA
jgi:hypothetical protein